MENYKNVSQDIRDQLNAEAEAIQIILIGIDNDIYSTVDACPNACEISPQSTRNRGKSIVTSSAHTYDPEPATVTEDEEMSKDNEIDKLMALISLSLNKIYKPTNNKLPTSSNTSRANQDNFPRINRGTGYDNQRVVNVAGARENVGTSVVQKSGIQCYNCKEYGHLNVENKADLEGCTDDDSEERNWTLFITMPMIVGGSFYSSSDSGCSNAHDRNLKLLTNFVEKFLGTVKFRNDQIAPILGYGDLVQGTITIKRVYYVEGLNHNLFSVGQSCDADLEVAFRKSTCYIRDLKGNDLLTGSRGIRFSIPFVA
ncbi:hypothetical protein Tco_0025186 [Tanacetum coccineum]